MYMRQTRYDHMHLDCLFNLAFLLDPQWGKPVITSCQTQNYDEGKQDNA